MENAQNKELEESIIDKEGLKIAGIMRESIVDGPGIRFVVFCQGCPHDCLGCHNPDTHDFEGGYFCEFDKILAAIDKNPLLAGVTFSGGEPMCQAAEFEKLGREIKKRNLNLLIFTGYTYEELIEMGKTEGAILNLLNLADYLVDGKYLQDQRDISLRFRGSKNQRFIDLNATRTQGKLVLAE